MSSSFLWILVLVFSVGALFAAWAGIRSIQSARTVVFYRTRQARMMAGWQWLAASLVLALFAAAAMLAGNAAISQIISLASMPTTTPTWTLTPAPTSPLPNTGTDIRISTQSASATGAPGSPLTATMPVTPSRTPPYLGTYTALAIWTERRSTFIAMLSFTPTASRTPIPTWTRTPSSTPRPTYTASPTRTPRPTVSLIPTHTSPPTWTASPTRTPRPTLTPTSTSTRTATATP